MWLQERRDNADKFLSGLLRVFKVRKDSISKKGDNYVYCFYGSVKCPPIQETGKCDSFR